MTQRLLIAGCGKLGTELGQRLAATGTTVYGLRRQADQLPAPIRGLSADLGDPEAVVQALPEALDAVIYTATPGAFDDAAYERGYVRGLDNVLAALAARRLSPTRTIFVSSTSVYGDFGGDWIDETSPTEPGGFSGKRLLQAEALLHEAPGHGIVLRLGGIYGPGRERLLRRVRDRKPVSDTPAVYTNRIHQADCVGVLEHLLQLPDPASLYLGVDHAPTPMHEVLDWLADTMNLPRPPRDSGSGRDRRGSNKRCSNRRLVDSGYRFVYPDFRAGYRAMLEQR